MFKSLGLFQPSRCPEEPCLRPYCLFAHTKATATAGPSKISESARLSVSSKRKIEGDIPSKTGAEAGPSGQSVVETAGKRKREAEGASSNASSSRPKVSAPSGSSVDPRGVASTTGKTPLNSSSSKVPAASIKTVSPVNF